MPGIGGGGVAAATGGPTVTVSDGVEPEEGELVRLLATAAGAT